MRVANDAVMLVAQCYASQLRNEQAGRCLQVHYAGKWNKIYEEVARPGDAHVRLNPQRYLMYMNILVRLCQFRDPGCPRR